MNTSYSTVEATFESDSLSLLRALGRLQVLPTWRQEGAAAVPIRSPNLKYKAKGQTKAAFKNSSLFDWVQLCRPNWSLAPIRNVKLRVK